MIENDLSTFTMVMRRLLQALNHSPSIELKTLGAAP
jgi:hypothetical protein